MNSENDREVRRLAADLLEGVLNGGDSAAEVLKKWPRGSTDKLVEKAHCLLFHFRDDEDIRSKDRKYAEWQRAEFRSIIRGLRRRQS